MTKKQKLAKAKELRETADRYEGSLNCDASMSSEEWVSPERQIYVRSEANKMRQQAAKLESSLLRRLK